MSEYKHMRDIPYYRNDPRLSICDLLDATKKICEDGKRPALDGAMMLLTAAAVVLNHVYRNDPPEEADDTWKTMTEEGMLDARLMFRLDTPRVQWVKRDGQPTRPGFAFFTCWSFCLSEANQMGSHEPGA